MIFGYCGLSPKPLKLEFLLRTELMQTIPIMIAASAGLSASVCAALVTRTLFKQLGKQPTFKEVVGDTLLLIRQIDGKEFAEIYARSVRRISKLAAMQFAKALAILLPLVAIYFISSILWTSLTKCDRGYILLMPASKGSIATNGKQFELTTTESYYPLGMAQSNVSLSIEGQIQCEVNPLLKQAMCNAGLGSIFIQGMGFEAINFKGDSAAISVLVSRPFADDWNPLWPWLSDAECMFVLSATGGALLLSLAARPDNIED
jgi:hypothetical protein